MASLHVTSLPNEDLPHADSIFLEPGKSIWPHFLRHFNQGRPEVRSILAVRSRIDAPPVRRDRINRHRYLVPNSFVVSRRCPHTCGFRCKEAFSNVAI